MGADALALLALLLGQAASAGLEVELRPPVLTLATGQRARVVVRSPTAPRVFASAGTLGQVAETAAGTWEADLEPPAEAHPQLAIVIAVSEDQVRAAVLPLVGRGVAVATTRPKALVSVRIRERAFGPVQADARGVASVPVEVPPGERYAYQRGRALDLRVPPLRRVHAALGAGEVRADREETVPVYVAAAEPDGAPWAGAPPELSPSLGLVTPPREVAPGTFVAAWTLPPGAAGAATLEARAGGTPAAHATLRRVPGPAARVSLRVARERVVAGEPPVGLVAEVTDAAGNPVDAEVMLGASFGAISGVARSGPGIVTASYAVPERLDGRAEAVLEAAAGGAVDRRPLALAPAAPEPVALEVEPPEVVARAGGLEGSAGLRPLAPPRRLAATAALGVLHAAGGFTAATFGGGAELWPLSLGGRYGVAAGLAFARASHDAQADVGAARLAIGSAVELWPVTVTALARRRVSPRVSAVAGAGAGVVAIRSLVSLDGVATADEWGRALGVHATAGAALDLPWRHVRLRLDGVLAWQEDPGMRSFRGSLTTFGLALGVAHDAL